ncbi:MAG TPA: hypothetical protein VD948_09775, partial [Rhodothermales bacterium]|nr:hypothetical protein [Rhodothermales bacterium]
MLPVFNELTGKGFSVGDLAGSGNALVLVALVAFVGVAAGSYPATVLARFQPAAVLRGGIAAQHRSRFASGLVV